MKLKSRNRRKEMRKIFLSLGLLIGLASSAMAQGGQANYNKGLSSWTVTGIVCTTGTAVELSAGMSGIILSAYRIQNQDSADAVWLGHTTLVSSSALSNLGEKLTAGSNGVWELGYESVALRLVTVWCLAADAAGAAGVTLSRARFGYR